MSTRELARKLGALEVIYSTAKATTPQPFDYLLVLDFEATCWSNGDPRKNPAEIIEFPVVLYDVKNAKIIAEFQQYVMPVENPKLSDFCTELTGIQQHQVDNGVPLQACLLLFSRWVAEKMRLYDMDFPNGESQAAKTCAFATWSDWDLGTCLRKECIRKNIRIEKMYRKWIDIRALFKRYIRRPFIGLSGALAELGLTFEGTEHCGLHDARNTARLVGKMVDKGVVLQLTRR
ncbi:ERI1 exoribonuclease 2-like Protein [Tribolium castaneum]|uniref:ERI1 exoribonuclease 2-like Protein n=1 Tax=Tribolium castaneum TaxID=7070 RepID=D6WAL3_TRICA|nr:ERI1 exoribonuclease 2-like Protein [Tribolium castaneum]